MTRIGSVTVKAEDARAPTVMQYITENGERELATFKLEGRLFNDMRPIIPGSLFRVTHVRYRRVA